MPGKQQKAALAEDCQGRFPSCKYVKLKRIKREQRVCQNITRYQAVAQINKRAAVCSCCKHLLLFDGFAFAQYSRRMLCLKSGRGHVNFSGFRGMAKVFALCLWYAGRGYRTVFHEVKISGQLVRKQDKSTHRPGQERLASPNPESRFSTVSSSI